MALYIAAWLLIPADGQDAGRRGAGRRPPGPLPLVLDGLSWCDGGIVDIFPVRPVLDIEPAVDTAVAVNCFYPHEFGGEDITGWDDRPLSIVSAASQVRTCQASTACSACSPSRSAACYRPLTCSSARSRLAAIPAVPRRTSASSSCSGT